MQLPRMTSLVIMASLGSPAQAQEATQECARIEGTFLVAGVAEDVALGTRRDARYGQAHGAPAEAHHFRYVLDPATGIATSTLLDEAGAPLRESFRVPNFSCKGGRMERQEEVRGGGEGCAKEGRIGSSVSINAEGTLVFSIQEHWEFGFLCFAKPIDARRTRSFPKYEAPRR